jgi:hypothetical protein
MFEQDRAGEEPAATTSGAKTNLMQISVTGQVVKIGLDGITFDWYGGSAGRYVKSAQLVHTLNRLGIQEGDWFEGTSTMQADSELVSLEVHRKTASPTHYSEEELAQSYAELKPALLPPM